MTFRNNTIYKRILIYFILFVFLPVMVITSILFVNIKQQHERITLAASTTLSNQYQTTIESYLQQKLDMLNSMSSYNQLTVFLSSPYQPRIDFELYNSYIISYFQGFSGQYYKHSIRLYITNETIPEGHSTIYPISYISESNIIQTFIARPDTTAIYPDLDFSSDNTHDDFFDSDHNMIILHKVINHDELTAIIVLRLPESDIFGLQNENQYKKIGNTYYINHSSKAINTLPFNSMTKSKDVLEDLAYTKSSLSDFPYELLIVTDSEEPSSFLPFYQLLIVLVLLLASSFMLHEIYKMTQRIQTCFTLMNASIKDDFSRSLPVTGNDEITGISRTINHLLGEIKHLIKKTVEQETIGKETQIFALQNQINPHFIYNTMEIFSSQMELFGHYDESDAMSDFARMLRYNLAGRDYFASVKEEISHMNSYLSIQKIKYPEIQCILNIPDEIYVASIIRFIFQPIIENSIQHGLIISSPALIITITATIEENHIHFSVEDNGKGILPAMVSRLNYNFTSPISTGKPTTGGIGLANINNRLRLFYGKESALQIKSTKGQSTIIDFKIPYERYEP